MTNTNTPQAALDIIANAVAQLEALRTDLDAKVWDDATPTQEALKASKEWIALTMIGGPLDALKELEKKFS